VNRPDASSLIAGGSLIRQAELPRDPEAVTDPAELGAEAIGPQRHEGLALLGERFIQAVDVALCLDRTQSDIDAAARL
jgi:hypothetical protein